MKLINQLAEYLPQQTGIDGIYKQIELWKPIKDFENYEVSSFGRVRRVVDKDNGIYKIKAFDDVRGYKRVILFNHQKHKRYQVHRLVAITFIPNPFNLPQVNHKDENPSNNNVLNLEWCTNKYNMNYGTAIERQVAKRSKCVIQYDLNMNFIAEYKSTQDASKQLNISQGLISICCNGGYWRDNHTKYIKCNKVHNFIFKYKDNEIN